MGKTNKFSLTSPVALVLFLIALSGCAPMAIYTQHDDFNKTTISRGQTFEVKADSGVLAFFNTTRLNLGPEKVTLDGGKSFLFLEADFWNADWMFIGEGRSLRLILDGETKELESEKDSDSIRTVISGNLVREQARYPVDLKTLQRIADAKSVRVRLEGKNSRFDGSISQLEREKLSLFLAELAKL